MNIIHLYLFYLFWYSVISQTFCTTYSRTPFLCLIILLSLGRINRILYYLRALMYHLYLAILLTRLKTFEFKGSNPAKIPINLPHLMPLKCFSFFLTHKGKVEAAELKEKSIRNYLARCRHIPIFLSFVFEDSLIEFSFIVRSRRWAYHASREYFACGWRHGIVYTTNVSPTLLLCMLVSMRNK